MPKKKLKKSNDDENICKLCLTDNEDEIMFGKKLTAECGNFHYFCLLFACGLSQNGDEEQGLYGFLSEDIRKEVLRANKLKCTYCKNYRVASACAIGSCRVKYHFNCGLQNNVLFKYFDNFESFCVKHRPEIDQRYRNIDFESSCNICLEKFKNSNDNDDENLIYQILLTECCSKFLHINCVKHQAFNAGLHFIKCPLCNDRNKFIRCVQEHGVYIPDADAQWEDPQAWRDMESSYSRCDAIYCKCPNGRSFNDDYTEWEIFVCVTCGSYGCHQNCMNGEIDSDEFECPECLKLNSKLPNKKFKSITINDRDASDAQCDIQSDKQSDIHVQCNTNDENQESNGSSNCEIIVIELSSNSSSEQIECQFDSSR